MALGSFLRSLSGDARNFVVSLLLIASPEYKECWSVVFACVVGMVDVGASRRVGVAESSWYAAVDGMA